MASSSTWVIIPALMRSESFASDSELLTKTVESVLSETETRILLLLQGDNRSVSHFSERYGSNPDVKMLYANEPLGKWGGVKLGVGLLKHVYRSDRGIYVLMDSDFSFHGNDIPALIEPLARGDAHYVIGNRDRVALPTPGASADERMYVELYFNTLCMIRLKEHLREFVPFDIQCGLQAFDHEVFSNIDFNRIPNAYGGEIEIFSQNVIGGYLPETSDVTHHNVSEASFNIKTVVESLLQLPIYGSLSRTDRGQALDLCPRIYGSRIKDASAYLAYMKTVMAEFDLTP